MGKAYDALLRFVRKRYSFLVSCVFLCALMFVAYFFYRHAVWHDEMIEARSRLIEHLQTGSPETIVKTMRPLKRMVAWAIGEDGKVHDLNGLDFDCRRIALGYELRGDYDKALKWLDHVPDDIFDPFDVARIKFKKGNKAEAFKAYCNIYKDMTPESLESNRAWVENTVFMKEVVFDARRKTQPLHLERLSPFRDYAEFLAFINEEYEALGRPAEQAEAVEWYRAMAPAMSQSAPAEPTPDSGEAGEL